MGENSKIEWCDHTFNPWIGCTKVSEGCKNCYANTLDRRAGGNHWGPTAERRMVKDWYGPRRWNRKAALRSNGWETAVNVFGGGDESALLARGFIKPRRPRVFCASMADVFDDHPSILPEWRDRLWTLIRETPHLDWLLLTKRPENIRAILPDDWGRGWDHVWLGTSVEDQSGADERIPHLLAVPAAKRFVSCEPLLGPVNLGNPIEGLPSNYWITHLDRIDWVIVGGESGPKARPMHPDWVRDLREQCADTETPFFFKQWGEWADADYCGKGSVTRWPDGSISARVGKKGAGRLLDGREHNEVPE